MTLRSLVEWTLLAAGVGAELICCVGLALARDAFDRLHYVSAANVVGPVLIAGAVLAEEGFTQPGVNAVLVAGFLVALSPVLAVETARAARAAGSGQREDSR